jgi:hypothetical protein
MQARLTGCVERPPEQATYSRPMSNTANTDGAQEALVSRPFARFAARALHDVLLVDRRGPQVVDCSRIGRACLQERRTNAGALRHGQTWEWNWYAYFAR